VLYLHKDCLMLNNSCGRSEPHDMQEMRTFFVYIKVFPIVSYLVDLN
jgi:hypothetical protein